MCLLVDDLRGIRTHVNKVIHKPFGKYCTDYAEIMRAHWKLIKEGRSGQKKAKGFAGWK